MDATPFDRIVKLFAARRTRRQTIIQGGAGLTAAGLARPAQAQEATPAAAAAGEKTEFLFVQSFRSGTIEPKAGEDGTYTLTLEGGLGQTIYFSDRPERIVGAAPTARLLGGLGFPEDDPPNAALVVAPLPGETDIAVLELFNPAYDEATHTATYEVKALAAWEDALGVGLTETPADLAALAPSFGAAHLFIDDCPNGTIQCNAPHMSQGSFPIDSVGFCWNWDRACCQPCTPNGEDPHAYYAGVCAQRYPGACNTYYQVGVPTNECKVSSWSSSAFACSS